MQPGASEGATPGFASGRSVRSAGEGGGGGDGGRAAAAARLLVGHCGVTGTDTPAGSRTLARLPLQGCQLPVRLGR